MMNTATRVNVAKDRKNKGFTLIEVMVSLSILGIASSLMLASFLNQVKTINRSIINTGAVFSASFILDQMRSQDISNLPNTGSDPAVEVTRDSKTYNVVVSYCQDSSFCSTNTRHLTADVSYKSKDIYSVETVYTKFE